MPTPVVDASDELTPTTVTAVFDVSRDVFAAWFIGVPLEAQLKGTDPIPGVKHTELLSGTWGQKGARRRVVLTDGGEALEEIIESDLPDTFRYIVWNYTTEAAAYVRYGVGEFRFEPVGDTTRVIWTYAFKPRGLARDMVPQRLRRGRLS